MSSQNTKPQNRVDRSISTILIGLASNVVLAVIKIAGGILGNSYALMADGIENTLDIFSSAVVLGGLKISAMPADECHPYGHGKAESLGAMIISLILLLAGIGIAIKSIIEIMMRPHHTPALFTLVLLAAVIVIKEILFRLLSSVGKSVNSLSLETEAMHYRSDALTSLAAFIGISIAIIGGERFASADDWAALVASGIIIFNGINMLRHAIDEIMDRAPNAECENSIRSIATKVAGVVAIEKCRARKSGLNLFVDIHVEVDGDMPVNQAHFIGHNVKDALMASSLGIADVLVHIEPAKK